MIERRCNRAQPGREGADNIRTSIVSQTSTQTLGAPMDQPSKMENLQFAQGILRELRQKAEADGEKLLTYLIDMAYLEASDRIRTHWIGHENENRRAKG
ncbi:hypothetical protein [Mesorhizobium sp.]|uniref:hypothetical protein n=1 Tax=Mesorhizobium sp. TaxID=1871066 RepID=UPI000FE9EFC5|nr:hypothetical protein [Mesorhizobium sp.]RWI88582.1 MAG: hypothetical protein EOR21_27360 [Mesorhizobium sp.]